MAARKQKHEEEEHVEGQERWLLTYADMITLLMVLFIVLFSIAQLDLKKFEPLRAGLNDSFGTPTPQLPTPRPRGSGVTPPARRACSTGASPRPARTSRSRRSRRRSRRRPTSRRRCAA